MKNKKQTKDIGVYQRSLETNVLQTFYASMNLNEIYSGEIKS